MCSGRNTGKENIVVRLVHASMENFIIRTKEKKLACFGGGIEFENFLGKYAAFQIESRIDYLIDNNKKKAGTFYNSIPISTLKQFVTLYDKDFIILITSSNYAAEMLALLDSENKLNDVECYYFKSFEYYDNLRFADVKTKKLLESRAGVDLSEFKAADGEKINLLFLTNFAIISNFYSGVDQKINSQINAFRKARLNVEKGEVEYFHLKSLRGRLRNLPFFSLINYRAMLSDCQGYDVYYIRLFMMDRGFVNFCRALRRDNQDAPIILELFTYPYDKETKLGLKTLAPIVKDRISRKKLFRSVDRIVTFSNDNEIWKIPTIRTINGIDIESIRKREVVSDRKVISIITVATFTYWQGIDRFLRGLGEYYQSGGTKKIVFHLVGYANPELESARGIEESYREIVNQYVLHERVIFHGKKTGEELDAVYDQAQIGLETLGRHRSGVDALSTLKTVEYVAKGLPVVGSSCIPMFGKNYSYYLQLPADETAIQMTDIIKFYDEIYPDEASFQKTHDEIRAFAENTCDMNVTMKPVIDYIKKQR